MEFNDSTSGSEPTTSFRQAIFKRNAQEVKKFLKQGSHVNSTTCKNQMPLHKALALKMGIDIVIQLLLQGADVHAIDANGNTALHLSVDHGAVYVRQLLKHGAHVNATNFLHRTPLHRASLSKANVSVVNELLYHGACVSITDFLSRTALHYALIYWADMEVVKSLLHHDADVNVPDYFGDTPLHVGVTYSGNECLKELLNHGANVRVANHFNVTPLHKALLSRRDVEVVRGLLHHGAFVDAVDDDNNTALQYGVMHSIAVARYTQSLISTGNINVTRHANEPVVQEALSSFRHWTNMDMMEVLLAYGANLHVAGLTGITPLRRAMDCMPIAKFLVKHGLIHTFKGDFSNFLGLNTYNNLRNYSALAHYFEECICELVKMKTLKINDNFSLYAFIANKNSNIPLYLEDGNIQIIKWKEKLFTDYPIYSDIILPKVNYSLERVVLLRKLNKMCIYHENCCGLMKSLREKVELNYDCMSVIFKFLHNGDLSNLMLAFRISNSNNSKSNVPSSGIGKGELEKRFPDSPASSCTKKARIE